MSNYSFKSLILYITFNTLFFYFLLGEHDGMHMWMSKSQICLNEYVETG